MGVKMEYKNLRELFEDVNRGKIYAHQLLIIVDNDCLIILYDDERIELKEEPNKCEILELVFPNAIIERA